MTNRYPVAIRVIAVILTVTFIFQDMLWADPVAPIRPASSLQIDSFVRSVVLDGLNPRNALITTIQYLRHAVDLEHFDLRIRPSIPTFDGRLFDLIVDCSPPDANKNTGKRKEGDNWIIPCSIMLRGANEGSAVSCEAVVSQNPDKPVELIFDGKRRDEPRPSAPVPKIAPSAPDLPANTAPDTPPDDRSFAKHKASLRRNAISIASGLIFYGVFRSWLGLIGEPAGLAILASTVAFPLITYCLELYLERGLAPFRRKSIFAGMKEDEKRITRKALMNELLVLLESENPELRNPGEEDPSKKDPYIRLVRIIPPRGNRISEFKPFGNVIQISEDFFTKNGYENDLKQYAKKIFWRFRLIYVHEREHAKRLQRSTPDDIITFMLSEIFSIHAEYTALFQYSKNRFFRRMSPALRYASVIPIITYLYALALTSIFIFIPYTAWKAADAAFSYLWHKVSNPKNSVVLFIIYFYDLITKNSDIGPRVSFDEAVKHRYAAIIDDTFRRIIRYNLNGHEILAEYLLGGEPDLRLIECFNALRNHGGEFAGNDRRLTDFIFEIADTYGITGLPSETERAKQFPEFAQLVKELDMVYAARVEERLHGYAGEANPLPSGVDDPTYEMEMQSVVAHAYRVARLVKLVGRRLGLTEDEMRRDDLGALLHDVGKADVIEIITKPRGLTKEEFAIVNTHARRSTEIILDKLGRQGRLREDEKPFDFSDSVRTILDNMTYAIITEHHTDDLDGVDDRTKFLVDILKACDILDALMDMTRLYLGGRPKPLSLIFEILEKKNIDPRVIDEIRTLSREDIRRQEGGRTLFEIIMENQVPFLRLQTGITMATLLENGIWDGKVNPMTLPKDAYFTGQRLKCYEAVIDSNLALGSKIDLIRLIDEFTRCVIDHTNQRAHREGYTGTDVVLEQVNNETPVLLYDSSYRVDLSRETIEEFLRGVPVILKGKRDTLEKLYDDFRKIAQTRLFGSKDPLDYSPDERVRIESLLKNIYAMDLTATSVRIVPLNEMLAPPKSEPGAQLTLPAVEDNPPMIPLQPVEAGRHIRNIIEPDKLVQNMLEEIISILLTRKKLALAFHAGLTNREHRDQQLLMLLKEVEKLKGKGKHKDLLQGLTIIEEFSSANDLEVKLGKEGVDIKNKSHVVFTFAPKSEEGDLKGIAREVNSVYVDDHYVDQSGKVKAFDRDMYYYPLFEIVTISLIKYHSGYTRKRIREILKEMNIDMEELNIEDFVSPAELVGAGANEEEVKAFLVFKLIPKTERYNTNRMFDRQILLRNAIEICA